MSLSRHVDPDKLSKHVSKKETSDGSKYGHHFKASTHHYPFGSKYQSEQPVPKFRIPKEGIEPNYAANLVRAELELDGKPTLNLASFVNTYQDDTAQKLAIENMAKNLSDSDEYPSLMALQTRCVSMLSHLWNVHQDEQAIGAACTGSSEAIHLGGLALKRRWQEKMTAKGKSTLKPNIIMGANAQVALEKFARYFEVEARILPVSEKSHYCLDPSLVKEHVDENTIGVFVILGSTYTGHYEPVEEVSKILDQICEETNGEIDVEIHVDAASGGFVAPFVHAQQGKFDFSLKRVVSINTSGHKFGLALAGIGWVVWRDERYLPKHLIFTIAYLGSPEETFTLNFSRPGSQMIVQYYLLIQLGFDGYRSLMENALRNARTLSKAIEETGWYFCLSDIHRPLQSGGVLETVKQKALPTNQDVAANYTAGLPVVSFQFSKKFKEQYPKVKQFSVSLLLRAKSGWIVPNYNLPAGLDKEEILRVVVRPSMPSDLIDKLIRDIVDVTETVIKAGEVDLTVLATPTGSSLEHDMQRMGVTEQQSKDVDKPTVFNAVC